MIELTFAQRENIGFQYVLEALRPCSPYGQELVRELVPMGPCKKPELLRQLNNIQHVLDREDACRTPLNRLLRVLMSVKMVRATAKKCLEAPLNEIELFEMKRFLLKCGEMLPLWNEIQPIVGLEGIFLEDTTEALDLLDPEQNRVVSFYVGDDCSQKLRTLRKEKRDLEERIHRLPDGGEKEELQTLRARIAADEDQEESRIRDELSLALRPHIPKLLHNMQAIADLDLTVEKARLARRYGGVMPLLTADCLVMEDMVNPRISDLLQEQGKTFTPVSIRLQRGATVITGANMGGKSVALKTIALNILLIHCGFFPFARTASAPLFDSMHIISEDLESIDRGLSSFGGEMVRFNQVVRELDRGFAFILLDEFARGTNPDEGAAIVQAVTEYLDRRNAVTVLATHYDNVAQRGSAHYQVIGLKDLDVDRLRQEIAHMDGGAGVERISRHMNYGLYRVEGKQDCPRDALNICRLLGMDPRILEIVEKNYGLSAKTC